MSLRNLQNKVKVCTLQDKSLQFAKKMVGWLFERSALLFSHIKQIYINYLKNYLVL